MNTEPTSIEIGPLLDFLGHLGQAYLASGEQTAEVERIVRRSAAAYGVERPRVVAFPTAIFLCVRVGEDDRTSLAEGPTRSLRLDQIADVYRLGEAAQQGTIAPKEGLDRLADILNKPAHFGVAGAVWGNAVLSVGLAMVLMPTPANLAAAALLGAVVGALKLINRNRALLSVPMPVLAAAVVSFLVFQFVHWGLPVDPLHALIPPLVTFLPGGRLTLGMIELAYGDMVSGSSRLMTGLVELLLLAFGLVAGAALVGYSAANLTDYTQQTVPDIAAHGAAWLGVLLFGAGVYFHFSAPRGALRWMLLTVVVAFGIQQALSGWMGSTAGGFFAMLTVTPLSYVIQLRWKGPPAMVTFLPGFWILVPGALSLLSMKYMLSDREAGLEGLTTATLAIVSIALGTLIGASIYKALTETVSWSHQQLRRARRGGERDPRDK